MSIFIEQVKKYLQNQQDLFGEHIIVDPEFIKKYKIQILNSLDSEINISNNSEPKSEAILSNEPIIEDNISLEEFRLKICECKKCPLGETRNNFVFGSGNPNANLMIIGEAPGADEDEQGMPFVGKAGQLLTKIIEAIEFSRDEVFIANIIKCRPPQNRRPTNEETSTCIGYLNKQIEIIKPKLIVALGLTAIDSLTGKAHKMGDTRGKFFEYQGIPLMVTYHPAALLYDPKLKASVWEDVQKLRKYYDELVGDKPPFQLKK